MKINYIGLLFIMGATTQAMFALGETAAAEGLSVRRASHQNEEEQLGQPRRQSGEIGRPSRNVQANPYTSMHVEFHRVPKSQGVPVLTKSVTEPGLRQSAETIHTAPTPSPSSVGTPLSLRELESPFTPESPHGLMQPKENTSLTSWGQKARQLKEARALKNMPPQTTERLGIKPKENEEELQANPIHNLTSEQRGKIKSSQIRDIIHLGGGSQRGPTELQTIAKKITPTSRKITPMPPPPPFNPELHSLPEPTQPKPSSQPPQSELPQPKPSRISQRKAQQKNRIRENALQVKANELRSQQQAAKGRFVLAPNLQHLPMPERPAHGK